MVRWLAAQVPFMVRWLAERSKTGSLDVEGALEHRSAAIRFTEACTEIQASSYGSQQWLFQAIEAKKQSHAIEPGMEGVDISWFSASFVHI